MKLYLMCDSEKNIEELKKENKRFDYQIIGTGNISKTSFNEVSLGKPDVVILGECELEEIKALLEVAKESEIIMLAKDINRALEIQNTLLNESIETFNFIDINTYGPAQILKNVGEYFNSLEKNNNKIENIDEIVIEEVEKNIQTTPSETFNEVKDSVEYKKKENSNEKEEIVFSTSEEKEEEKIEYVNEKKAKYDITSLKTKTIHFHSKKGGTGKTMLSKEVANQFSSIKLPKKLNKDDNYLKTCIVDFDFERGNLRCQLGIVQSTPSIYDWIEDIVTKMEKGISFENIKYNSIQIMTQFVRKIKDGLYAVPTSQGELPSRIYRRIEQLEGLTENNNIFKSICDKIITSLKGIFDILVIDTDSDLSEANISAYEHSDANIIVLNPTISDFENAKVLLEQLEHFETIDPETFAVVINKDLRNSGIEDDMDEMIELLQINTFNFDEGKKEKKKLPLIGTIPYDAECILFENSHAFLTDGTGIIKKSIIQVCEYILPVFKIKVSGQANMSKALLIKQLKEKKKLKVKKTSDKLDELLTNEKNDVVNNIVKEAVSKSIEEKSFAQSETTNSLETPYGSTDLGVSKESEEVVIEGLDDISSDKKRRNNVTKERQFSKRDIFSLKYDKNITLDEFIGVLKKCPELDKTTAGTPIMTHQPQYLSKKIWKQYLKVSLK